MTQSEDSSVQPTLDPADADRPGAPGTHPQFDALVRTVWRLRQPDGCPWDKVQTHASIAKNMVEEAYEAVDAIEAAGSAESSARKQRHLVEELGDVLMQVVLQSQIAADDGEFDIDEVCRGINEKLIRRHPHVFGGCAPAANETEALGVWEQVKIAEHAAENADGAAAGEEREGLLESVPVSLPALLQCQKISRKAAAAGFEWPDVAGVRAKVAEEMAEFDACEAGSAEAEMEFGDILFALVNWARWEHIDAESALRASNAKFRRRWAYMEQKAWESGRDIADLSNSEQEALWAEAKSKENQ